MDIDNNKQIAVFFQKIGKEVWEQGELSPGSKAILRSIIGIVNNFSKWHFNSFASEQTILLNKNY